MILKIEKKHQQQHSTKTSITEISIVNYCLLKYSKTVENKTNIFLNTNRELKLI